MLVKLLKDRKYIKTVTCGDLFEILSGDEYSPNIAVLFNVGVTEAHFHNNFDEIYFVLNGFIVVKLYVPNENRLKEIKLKANELCVISKGIHHKIIKASKKNRLCALSIPKFNPDDEYISNIRF
jgi:mannose-6-phosphate isomerase-like protein (cupin superfamily)